MAMRTLFDPQQDGVTRNMVLSDSEILKNTKTPPIRQQNNNSFTSHLLVKMSILKQQLELTPRRLKRLTQIGKIGLVLGIKPPAPRMAMTLKPQTFAGR
jgi:hypothetical protein